MSFIKNFLTAISEDSMINRTPEKTEQTESKPTTDDTVVFTSFADIFDSVAARPEPEAAKPIDPQPAAAQTEPTTEEPPVIELVRVEPIEAESIKSEPAEPTTDTEPTVEAEPIAATPAAVTEPAPDTKQPIFVPEYISELFSLTAPTEPIAPPPVVTVAEPIAPPPVVTVAEPIAPPPIVTVAEPITVEKEPLSIASYFASNGVEISLPAARKDAIAPIESLAFSIAVGYSHTKNFIRYLRECICKKNYNFSYTIAPSATADKPAIIALANLLNEYCIISGLNKSNNIVRGTISSCPKCINFLCGDFAEMYAKSVTVGVLKKLSAEYGEDFELYNNVKIEKNGEKHELDIVFRVGSHVFWEEIKSGEFDADKYRKIGTLLNLVPDRLILLAAEKSNDAVQGISYFYDYFCANTNTFKGSLTEMIKKAFEEETNND